MSNEVISGKKCDSEIGRVNDVSKKQFKKLLRRKGTEVYFVVLNSMNTNNVPFRKETNDEEFKKIISEYSDVFKSSLRRGLLPNRSVDHEIETDPNVKIPNRRLFRLSSDELRATRQYMNENLENGRIARSKSPYGAPLFFAKQVGNPLFSS